MPWPTPPVRLTELHQAELLENREVAQKWMPLKPI